MNNFLISIFIIILGILIGQFFIKENTKEEFPPVSAKVTITPSTDKVINYPNNSLFFYEKDDREIIIAVYKKLEIIEKKIDHLNDTLEYIAREEDQK